MFSLVKGLLKKKEREREREKDKRKEKKNLYRVTRMTMCHASLKLTWHMLNTKGKTKDITTLSCIELLWLTAGQIPMLSSIIWSSTRYQFIMAS